MFWDKIKKEFSTQVPVVPTNRRSNYFSPVKPVDFTNILPSQISTKVFNKKSGNGKSANKPIAPA